MRAIKRILFGVLIVAGLQAAAIDGSKVYKGAPKAGCRILFRDSENKLLGICSGLLTGKNKVTTAAHCLEARSEAMMTVQCGFEKDNLANMVIEKTLAGNSVDTGSSKFQELHKVLKIHKHPTYQNPVKGVDTAWLELDTDSRIVPYPIATPAEIQSEYFENTGRLRAGTRCLVSGFGLQDGKAGIAYSVMLPSSLTFRHSHRGWYEIFLATVSISNSEEAVIGNGDERVLDVLKGIPAEKRIEGSAMPGDSGGPLICQGRNGWKLVGVVRGAQIQKMPGPSGHAAFGNLFWNPYEASHNEVPLEKPKLP